jgi:hypothetical protein
VSGHRDEEAFSIQNSLSSANQLVHETAAAGSPTVTKESFHLDRRVLVHPASGFADSTLARIELALTELEVSLEPESPHDYWHQ